MIEIDDFIENNDADACEFGWTLNLEDDKARDELLANQENIGRVNDLMAELDITNLELFCATAFQYKKIYNNIIERWDDFYKTTGGLESHDMYVRDFIMKVMGWKE